MLPRLDEKSTLCIELVQDAVEHALFEAGCFKTLRAYIVYRETRTKARDAKQSWVNVESSINEYLDQIDWRVNANANQGYSLGGLILNVSGKVMANYRLNFIYPAEVGRAHREADLHIHDLDMLSGYCAGWSLRTLLNEGPQRRGRQGRGRGAEAPFVRHGSDRQLPRHDAERVGGRPGVLELRHVSRALHQEGQPALRRSAPVHAGAHLQPERAEPLGHADAVHEPHVRLDVSRGTCAPSIR